MLRPVLQAEARMLPEAVVQPLQEPLLRPQLLRSQLWLRSLLRLRG
jgi:hypothetical protein